jgi:hyperosmotically inducible periplasmic protein
MMNWKGPMWIGILAATLAVGQDADNSKTNQRDRDSAAVTADQQKNNKSDADLTKKIRQSIYSDKTLSTYAHNVKIVAQDGRVTLRGPVRSDAEKDQIQQKAAAIAGADAVTNQLEVVPEKK